MVMLGPLEESHKEIILDILTDDRVKQTYLLPDFDTREAALPLFQQLVTISGQKDRFVRGIFHEGRIVGFLNDVEITDDAIELGYVIHPEHQGKGYMTRALTLAIGELFSLGYREVITGAFESNTASIRVMEKCGMEQMKKSGQLTYRGQTHQCVYYSLRNRA